MSVASNAIAILETILSRVALSWIGPRIMVVATKPQHGMMMPVVATMVGMEVREVLVVEQCISVPNTLMTVHS
jgi:hypothetical protein